MRLKGKNALITGSSRGIGKSIALRFAKEGANVIICSRNEKELANVVKEGKDYLGNIDYLRCDLSENKDVDELIKFTTRKLKKLNILVNNAAIFYDNNMIDAEKKEIMKRANIDAINMICTSLIKIMDRASSIINISSINALLKNKYSKDYDTSKRWLNRYSLDLSKSLLKKGIRVNVICPGTTDSPLRKRILDYYGKDITQSNKEKSKQIPFGRLTTPEDIAATCVFFASDESELITGQIITIDGGTTLSKGIEMKYTESLKNV